MKPKGKRNAYLLELCWNSRFLTCVPINDIFYVFQGPSASAYVTYIRSEDALRAIQCVNNVVVDGRTLKVTSYPQSISSALLLLFINCCLGGVFAFCIRTSTFLHL